MSATPDAITRGTTVRHNVHLHRGLGKVMAVGPTFLRSQTPKLRVAFERGHWLWCYPEDLTVVPAAAPIIERGLRLVELAPVVA